jgi:long-chain acyl-CoA synthetase
MNLSVTLGVPMILNIASPPVFGDILKWIEKYKITFIPGVPRMFIEINKHPDAKKTDFSSLVAAISGGAPLPLEVAREFKRITGSDLVEGYGLSETSPVTHVTPLGVPPKEGSIGPPVADTFIKIVDLQDESKTLDIGETGEIVLKGPQVFKGYWDMPEATAEVLSADGWFKTGDVGRMDEEGWAYVVDRKKEMVIVSGYNVYPAEVEDALFQHPKIAEAAVAGLTDEKRGEIVAAWVVVKEGESLSEQEVIDHCKEFLAPYKVPKRITFRESLPANMVGKVLRRKILEEEGHIEAPKPPE